MLNTSLPIVPKDLGEKNYHRIIQVNMVKQLVPL